MRGYSRFLILNRIVADYSSEFNNGDSGAFSGAKFLKFVQTIHLRLKSDLIASPLHLLARIRYPLFDYEFLSVMEQYVDERDKHERTPLNIAVIHGNKPIVKWLINQGATLELTDECGYTPLNYATKSGQMPEIQNALEQASSRSTSFK